MVRDSAGIRIVEHPLGAPDVPSWRVGTTPSVEIGRLSGEAPYLFQLVRDAARLPEGGIVVLEASAGEVRVFGPEGTHRRTLGRRGEGPGEFTSPLRVWPRGDSLVVFDWDAGRITLLSLDGSSARTIVPAGLPRAHDARVWFAEDRVVVPVKSPPPPMERREPAEVFISYVGVPLDGSPPDTLARVSAGRQERIEFTVDGRTLITAGLSPAMFQAVPRAAARGPDLWIGSGRRPAVRRLDLRDGSRLELRWSAGRRPVTDALLEGHIEDRAAASDDPEGVRETLEQVPVADSVPHLDELLVDGRRRLWVRPFPVPGDSLHPWLVFDRNGGRVARVEVPADLTLFRAGADWVLALRRDELDVQRVVVLPLEQDGT